MKKILIVAATAGLMSLAACGGETTNTAVENAVESHEANAAMYEEAADNTVNAVAENVLENAAAVEENAADALEANAH
jgi:rubrerythrin